VHFVGFRITNCHLMQGNGYHNTSLFSSQQTELA